MTDKSVLDKLNLAYDLAVRLAYDKDNKPTEEDNDIVWSYADGLRHQYFQNILTGHCSLKATVDFDLEKEEKILDDHIDFFTKRLAERKTVNDI